MGSEPKEPREFPGWGGCVGHLLTAAQRGVYFQRQRKQAKIKGLTLKCKQERHTGPSCPCPALSEKSGPPPPAPIGGPDAPTELQAGQSTNTPTEKREGAPLRPLPGVAPQPGRQPPTGPHSTQGHLRAQATLADGLQSDTSASIRLEGIIEAGASRAGITHVPVATQLIMC